MIHATCWNMLLRTISFFYHMIVHITCSGFVIKTEIVTSNALAIFEQLRVTRISLFFTLHYHHSVSRLGMGKRLGGDTFRIADASWPKGYLMPH